jgi:hypothetical protein
MKKHKAMENFNKKNAKILGKQGLRALYFSCEKRQSLIDKQIFFPHFFKIEEQCFVLLPKGNTKENFMKEIGVYKNKCYLEGTNIFNLVLNSIDKPKFKTKFESEFREPHMARFEGLKKILLDNKLCSIGGGFYFPRSEGTTASKKFEISTNSLEFSEIPICNSIKKLFFPKSLKTNLSFIVFRPFIVTNSLEEVMINILEINGFVIIKRKYKK